MNQTHQLNNSLSKIKIIYDLLQDDPESAGDFLKSLEIELEKIKELFTSCAEARKS